MSWDRPYDEIPDEIPGLGSHRPRGILPIHPEGAGDRVS